MRSGKGGWLVYLGVFCALVLGLSGCGGNGGSKTSTTDTKTILDATAKRLDAVKTVHFDLAIDGAAYIDTARLARGLSTSTGSPPTRCRPRSRSPW